MKFKGNANQLCRITKIKPHLVRKMPKAIRFDKEGVFETENPHLIKKLSTKFEVIEEIIEEIEEEIEEDVNLKDLPYQQLQVMYADKTGESAVGKRKADILKELEG
jgi:hypothetical protein